MQTHDIAPHLATLTRALGDKIGTDVSEQELTDELQKYLEYGVPPDQAVRTILRHHGADPGTPAPRQAAPEGRVPLAQAPGNAPNIELLVRVLTINTRTVVARGEEKEILWGLVGDETATVPYTAWRPLEGLQAGDVIHVENAYTKEFRGETQVNFGDRTRITKKDASELPERPTEFREVKVEDLKEGLRGFRITGRILEVGTKEVQVQGNPKTLWTGFLADPTGKVEFTCWDELKLEAGQVVTIEGGYVRGFRGVPQLNFDAKATISPFEDEFPDAEELSKTAILPLGRIIEQGAANDATIRATLLEVRPGSGLVWRDPETNRVLPTGQTKGGVPDLRMKMVLDDGTGSVSAVVGRESTERLLGKSLDDCIQEAKDAMTADVVEQELTRKLVGRVFRCNGFARTDEYGLMFIARDMAEDHEDPESTAREILDRLEAL